MSPSAATDTDTDPAAVADPDTAAPAPPRRPRRRGTTPILLRRAGLNRIGMERRGSRATFVLLGVVAALLLVAFGLGQLGSALTPPDSLRAVGGSTIEIGSGGSSFTVRVPGGWRQDTSRSTGGDVVLERPGVRVQLSTTPGVVDAGTFFGRRLRLLALQGLAGTVRDTRFVAGPPAVVIGDVDGSGRDAVEAVVVRRDGVALELTAVTVDGDLPVARSATERLLAGTSS